MLHTIHITVTDPYFYNSPCWGGGTIQRKQAEDVSYTIDCPGCDGWQECHKDHDTHDVDACLTPDTEPCICDPNEDDEFDFHGVTHTYRWGAGWTVPYQGCVIAGSEDTITDFVYETAYTYGPGSYIIEDDWDFYDLYLSVVSMADGSPLPEAGVWWEANAEKPEEAGESIHTKET